MDVSGTPLDFQVCRYTDRSQPISFHSTAEVQRQRMVNAALVKIVTKFADDPFENMQRCLSPQAI
jgi:hypothetical protein